MRRIVPALILTVLLYLVPISIPPGARAADLNTEELAVEAAAAYVLDTASNEILYSKAAERPRAIASTTKIMTALLVLELTNDDESVVISANAAATGGSTIGLLAGEQRTVDELLHALMLVSANDAAVALAEHVSGSVSAFSDLMNRRARAVGAKQTQFSVPHGLANGSDNYSTASDLAVITEAAMKNEDFAVLVATRRRRWAGGTTPEERELRNGNALLERYPPTVGVKTGFTKESLYCLVVQGEALERKVIVVILGHPSREGSFVDGQRLLDWALTKFDHRQFSVKDHRYASVTLAGKRVPLVADRTVAKLAYIGDGEGPTVKARLRPGLSLPLTRGDKVGTLTIDGGAKESVEVGLIVGRSIRSSYTTRNVGGYFTRVVKTLLNLF